MAIVECDNAHCKPERCPMFDSCDTKKKYGIKKDDISPLQKALNEKGELEKKLAGLQEQLAGKKETSVTLEATKNPKRSLK